MSHSIKGVVDNSYTKQKTSKAGKNFTINYCEVDGVSFSTGFKKMFDQGEMIDIEVENKYNEWQFKSQGGGNLPSAGAAPTTAKPANVTKGNFGRNMGSFPIDPKDGQMSIIRQSAINRAVEILGQLQQYGVVKYEDPEQYMADLINTALEVADFSSGQDITKVMDLAKAKAAAKEAV